VGASTIHWQSTSVGIKGGRRGKREAGIQSWALCVASHRQAALCGILITSPKRKRKCERERETPPRTANEIKKTLKWNYHKIEFACIDNKSQRLNVAGSSFCLSLNVKRSSSNLIPIFSALLLSLSLRIQFSYVNECTVIYLHVL